MAAQKKALGKGLSAILKDPNKDVETAADKGAKDLVGPHC
jgi:hypothetical protein